MQRAKAKAFLTREGHGAEARAVNVRPGDKNEAAHPSMGGHAMAKDKQAYDSAVTAADGLLRRHANGA